MALVVGDVTKAYNQQKPLKRADVRLLQEWLQMQPHLPGMSEMQLIHFLHSNKYSVEAAKKCIDLFMSVRTHMPEMFANRDPCALDYSPIMYYILPNRTPQSQRIIYGRLVEDNPEKYSTALQVKIFDMVTMLDLSCEGPIGGHIVLIDMRGFSVAYMTKISLIVLKKFLYYFQECIPIRTEGIHFLNTNYLMDKLLMLMKPFIKKEVMDILYLHPTMESLYNYVPQSCLPSDFDGDPSYSIQSLHDATVEKLKNNVAFFLEEEQQKVHESKRPGKPQDIGEIFGVEGTFKKLDID